MERRITDQKYKYKKRRAMAMIILLIMIVSIALLSIIAIQVVTTKSAESFLGRHINGTNNGLVSGRSLCYIDPSFETKKIEQLVVFYDKKGNVKRTLKRDGCTSEGINANSFNVTLIAGGGAGAHPAINFTRKILAKDNLSFFSNYAKMEYTYFDEYKSEIDKYFNFDDLNSKLNDFLTSKCKIYFNTATLSNSYCPVEGLNLKAGDVVKYFTSSSESSIVINDFVEAKIDSLKQCYKTSNSTSVVAVNYYPDSNSIIKYICTSSDTQGNMQKNTFSNKSSIQLELSYIEAKIFSREAGKAGEVITLNSKTFPRNVSIGNGGSSVISNNIFQGISGSNGQNTSATIDGIEVIAQGGFGGNKNSSKDNIVLLETDENKKLTQDKTYNGEYGQLTSYNINYDLIKNLDSSKKVSSFGAGGNSGNFLYKKITPNQTDYCIKINNKIAYYDICKYSEDRLNTNGMSVNYNFSEDYINKKTSNGAIVVEW